MEQYVQRPTKFFIPSLKENLLSAYFNGSTCIKSFKKTLKECFKALFQSEKTFFQECNFSFSETNQIIIIVSLEKKKKVKNPLHVLNPLSLIQQCFTLSSGWTSCMSQTKAKRKILKQWDPKKISITAKKRADNQTYIDMMLGMKLLQAATESGYPQSWACLHRHADSLCC